MKAKTFETSTETRDQFVVRLKIVNFEAFLIGFERFRSPFITKKRLSLELFFTVKYSQNVSKRSNIDSNSIYQYIKTETSKNSEYYLQYIASEK